MNHTQTRVLSFNFQELFSVAMNFLANKDKVKMWMWCSSLMCGAEMLEIRTKRFNEFARFIFRPTDH